MDGRGRDAHLRALLGHVASVRRVGAGRGRGHGHTADETRGGDPEHGVESAEAHPARACEALCSAAPSLRSSELFGGVLYTRVFDPRGTALGKLLLRAAERHHFGAPAGVMSLEEGEKALQRFLEWCKSEGIEHDEEVSDASPAPRRFVRARAARRRPRRRWSLFRLLPPSSPRLIPSVLPLPSPIPS